MITTTYTGSVKTRIGTEFPNMPGNVFTQIESKQDVKAYQNSAGETFVAIVPYHAVDVALVGVVITQTDDPVDANCKEEPDVSPESL